MSFFYAVLPIAASLLSKAFGGSDSGGGSSFNYSPSDNLGSSNNISPAGKASSAPVTQATGTQGPQTYDDITNHWGGRLQDFISADLPNEINPSNPWNYAFKAQEKT